MSKYSVGDKFISPKKSYSNNKGNNKVIKNIFSDGKYLVMTENGYYSFYYTEIELDRLINMWGFKYEPRTYQDQTNSCFSSLSPGSLIEQATAQLKKHKCNCIVSDVINFGCKCGGI